MSCGGVGKEKEATEEVQILCKSHQSNVEGKANKTFSEFTAISFSTQVVAGTNFFVKVHTGNEEFVHMRIFRPLPPNHEATELTSFETDKKREDPIMYF